MIDFADDTPGPTTDQLAEISQLAELQQRQQLAVDEALASLKQAEKALRQTREHDLPDAMQAAGIQEFTTSSGLHVEVTEKLFASIPRKNKPQCAQWLVDNNLSALVKEDVVVPFDRGDIERVRELGALLESRGYDTFFINESINTTSVKSAIKELLEAGTDVPLELFGAYFHRAAVVQQ